MEQIAEKFLNDLAILENRVFYKELAVEEWETAMGYQSPRFDGDGIRGTATLNKMDMLTNRHIELLQELEALNEQLTEYKKEAIIKIDDFGKQYPIEANLLMAKYVNHKTYQEIAKRTYYSERWVRKQKQKALYEFGKYLKEHYEL